MLRVRMDIHWSGQPDARWHTVDIAVAAMDDDSSLPDRLAVIEGFRALLAADKTVMNMEGDRPVTVSRVARVASSPPKACRFLHTLAAQHYPSTVVEMGTAVGISAAYIAAGVQPDARMWTVDLRELSALYAGRLFEMVGIGNVETVTGRFQDVLENVLAAAEPVDLLFVDGHHQQRATIGYTDQACTRCVRRHRLVRRDATGLAGDQPAATLDFHRRYWSLGRVCRLGRNPVGNSLTIA